MEKKKSPLGMTRAALCLPDSRLEEAAPQYFCHADYKLGTEYERGGAGGAYADGSKTEIKNTYLLCVPA